MMGSGASGKGTAVPTGYTWLYKIVLTERKSVERERERKDRSREGMSQRLSALRRGLFFGPLLWRFPSQRDGPALARWNFSGADS
jgi:hypothetical protein